MLVYQRVFVDDPLITRAYQAHGSVAGWRCLSWPAVRRGKDASRKLGEAGPGGGCTTWASTTWYIYIYVYIHIHIYLWNLLQYMCIYIYIVEYITILWIYTTIYWYINIYHFFALNTIEYTVSMYCLNLPLAYMIWSSSKLEIPFWRMLVWLWHKDSLKFSGRFFFCDSETPLPIKSYRLSPIA